MTTPSADRPQPERLLRGGPCPRPVQCPRCSGCGYEDCADCAETRAKRPTCWRCGGAGYVQCEITHDLADPSLCATLIPNDGELCDHCDQPTPPGEGGCLICWTPIPDNLADQKAIFAEMGLSVEKPHDGE